MDWPTIRVLTNNLEELLAQYERGEHEDAPDRSRARRPSAAWWIGSCGVATSLARALNVDTYELEQIQQIRRMVYPSPETQMVERSTALAALARKLLVELDAGRANERAAVSPAAHAGS